MEETFTLQRAWSPHSSAQEQVWSQNHAEEKFDWYVECMKQAGAEVSPIKRNMRTIKDEDGRDWLTFYRQMVKIRATEEIIQQLKHNLSFH